MAISLAGLSATYPGYSAEETARTKRDDTQANTASTTIDNQIKARDAAIKMLGANALGAALQGSGPQAPPPGQASVPASRMPGANGVVGNATPAPTAAIPPPAAPAVPQGGLPPSPQPAAGVSAPPAAGAAPITGKVGLQPMIAQIIAKSPNVANHPEILLSALGHAKDMGLLDPDAEAAVDGIQKQHTMNRIATAKQHLQAVQGGAPAGPQAPQPGQASMPTATNPQTGAKVMWNGSTWQPAPMGGPPGGFSPAAPAAPQGGGEGSGGPAATPPPQQTSWGDTIGNMAQAALGISSAQAKEAPITSQTDAAMQRYRDSLKQAQKPNARVPGAPDPAADAYAASQKVFKNKIENIPYNDLKNFKEKLLDKIHDDREDDEQEAYDDAWDAFDKKYGEKKITRQNGMKFDTGGIGDYLSGMSKDDFDALMQRAAEKAPGS